MKAYIAVPATLALVYRAWSHKSLTPLGIVAACLTATAHAIHPWSIFFGLLVVFFLAGSRIKHEEKERLTLSSSGASGGEGPRTHIQVLANSIVASVLITLHARQLSVQTSQGDCWPWRGDLLVVGIVANYAAVAADTFSSELGILSKTHPRLITSLSLRKVPPGTNGGVTSFGILAGFLGAFIIAITSNALLPFCSSESQFFGARIFSGTANQTGFQGGRTWGIQEKAFWVFAVTLIGGLGSLVDSVLGALLQRSVIDVRTGKVIEGDGGMKVPVEAAGLLPPRMRAPMLGTVVHDEGTRNSSAAGKEGQARERNINERRIGSSTKGDDKPSSRRIESGYGVLDNNGVNLLMAFVMSSGSMVLASWYWEIPLTTIMQ
ncbi:MAG: hypothetical protein M1812_000690 [Candelaria pacifica]|nr:MAG: hypothetical protein M1812_000690 [Candelaria pacifica]